MDSKITNFVNQAHGYGYGYGKGNGYGDGNGCGNGNGYGYGDGNGNGYGYGDDYGYGYGNSNGYGLGYGDGDGYGKGYGDGNGYGNGNGYGDSNGYGNGKGIKHINNMPVIEIDGTPTAIKHVTGNIAKGFVFRNFQLIPCYIVKQDDYFAHGKTLKEAVESLQEKILLDTSVEERIDAFFI